MLECSTIQVEEEQSSSFARHPFFIDLVLCPLTSAPAPLSSIKRLRTIHLQRSPPSSSPLAALTAYINIEDGAEEVNNRMNSLETNNKKYSLAAAASRRLSASCLVGEREKNGVKLSCPSLFWTQHYSNERGEDRTCMMCRSFEFVLAFWTSSASTFPWMNMRTGAGTWGGGMKRHRE